MCFLVSFLALMGVGDREFEIILALWAGLLPRSLNDYWEASYLGSRPSFKLKFLAILLKFRRFI
jgi:hypothetical protein